MISRNGRDCIFPKLNIFHSKPKINVLSIWWQLIAESGHFSISKIFFFILFCLFFYLNLWNQKKWCQTASTVHIETITKIVPLKNKRNETAKLLLKAWSVMLFCSLLLFQQNPAIRFLLISDGFWDSLKLPFDKISFDWNAHEEYWIYSRLSINRIMNKWHTKDPLRKYEFHFRKFFHPNNGPDPLILEVRNSIPNLFFFLIFSSVCFSSHTVKTFSKRH